ncbi:hypothetical protein [Levilactobacillus acidifarinae]|uniref:Uncharacterized protein n=1 Tax=Levilactobacillus acidifarinae DSM 19394 = JCM 15949 TaxID=1423715 RepID=A0A0R1LU61_9LACO|nr:hypothetical protein [Levilactobacillus acidifarinae]KRK95930.1 hypothetical protein FD25_GL002390 [Levilactobacillus acidifarinae DSM 19394]GEO69233.1 hypothetical protein LAC03_11430 [Levilactobacillus acidifarinae]
MKNRKLLTTLLVIGTSLGLFLALDSLNLTTAHAGMPASTYSAKTLKQNGFTKRTLAKKYRGTWYAYEKYTGGTSGSMDRLKITKNKVNGYPVKVANKLVKIKGHYRLGVYYDRALIYLSVTNKPRKLAYSLVEPVLGKHEKIVDTQITKHITFDIPYYRTQKQAKVHSY